MLLDDGRERPFDAHTFRSSGLRHLRVGQRLSIEVTDQVVSRLWITGIGDGQPIG